MKIGIICILGFFLGELIGKSEKNRQDVNLRPYIQKRKVLQESTQPLTPLHFENVCPDIRTRIFETSGKSFTANFTGF